jgi:signal transduction histidine kinase
MKGRISFRRKVFISQFLLLLVFIALLFPFVGKAVAQIVHKVLHESTDELISQLQTAQNEKEMISILKNQEQDVFFRVSLLNNQGQLVYDVHVERLFGEKYTPFYPTEHPEVVEAIQKGYGYNEGYSQIFHRKFAYVAEAFNFHGQKYILRAAFPFAQVEDLIRNFNAGFLIFSLFILLFFSLLTWIILARLSRPIQKIIRAIEPYQGGHLEQLPEIPLDKTIHPNEDFGKLALTLNSLSEKIRSQIKNLTEEKNEKEAILESLGEGVIAVDADLNVRYVNFIGSKMLGVPKRHLIGKPFPFLEDKPTSELLKRCLELLQACQEQQTILTDSLALGDGKKLYLDLIAAPKSQGQGAIIVLQDKSSNYKVLEMGKDFVANASHELRTPITIIKGFAETLQDLPEISTEMLADITEKIVRNCQRMENLVKNLLTLADIENLPETRFRECELIPLVENARHVLLSIYPDALVTIEKDQDSFIIAADHDLLELAVINLLDNAAKYSKPPAHILVKMQDRGEEVEMTIADKGIGIPLTDVEHIFERFYTVNKAHSRRLGGAGLGLSIVKNIIEKHDGTITVESTHGVGTTFIITLPKQRLGHNF